MNWNWGIIYIWLCPLGERLDFRTGGALPVTNGGSEIAPPSSVTFYGVQGFFFLSICDPAAKQLLFGLLSFSSPKTAFLTIPKGLKLVHQYQLWALLSSEDPPVGPRSSEATFAIAKQLTGATQWALKTLLQQQTQYSNRPAGCLDLLLWSEAFPFSLSP